MTSAWVPALKTTSVSETRDTSTKTACAFIGLGHRSKARVVRASHSDLATAGKFQQTIELDRQRDRDNRCDRLPIDDADDDLGAVAPEIGCRIGFWRRKLIRHDRKRHPGPA